MRASLLTAPSPSPRQAAGQKAVRAEIAEVRATVDSWKGAFAVASAPAALCLDHRLSLDGGGAGSSCSGGEASGSPDQIWTHPIAPTHARPRGEIAGEIEGLLAGPLAEARAVLATPALGSPALTTPTSPRSPRRSPLTKTMAAATYPWAVRPTPRCAGDAPSGGPELSDAPTAGSAAHQAAPSCRTAPCGGQVEARTAPSPAASVPAAEALAARVPVAAVCGAVFASAATPEGALALADWD